MIVKMKPIDPVVKRAALALLARGVVRPHEVAELAGVSLQVVNYWIKRRGVNWERTRSHVLGKAWRRELSRGD